MSSRKRRPSGRDRHFKAKLDEGKQNCEKYRQAQLSNKDKKDKQKGLREYAKLQARRIYGGLIKLITLSVENLKDRLVFLKKEIAKLETKISKTEDQNRTAIKKENQTPLQDWEGKDLGMYFSYLGLMVFAIVGGGVCLVVNAITTIPTYIENPIYSWFLLPLPIATVIAIKQIYEDCETDKGKKRISRFMSGCSLLFFSIWTCVLSLMFMGDSGEMDFEQLDQPNYLDGIFVVSQILAEVFVSGSLYIAASKIYSKYNPDIYQDNEQLLQLKESLTSKREEQKMLTEELSEKQKELIDLEADEASFVCEEMAMFQAQCARLEASAPDMGFFQNQMEVKMKQYILVAAVVLIILFFAGTKAFADDYVIGMSPHMKPEIAKTQVQRVSKFLINTLQPGDSAMVFNAYTNDSIASFKIPNRSAYKHRKVKMKNKSVREAIFSLRKFGEETHVPDSANGKSFEGSILWPDFLKFVANNYPAQKQKDIILFGSPFYVSTNPKMKGFSMVGGQVPGDGHLAAPKGQSPFTTIGSEQLLSNFRVHFALPNSSWKETDQHGHNVQRLISLYIERMGGKLISFTHDLPTIFLRVKEKAPAPNTNYVLVPTDKLEMNTFVYRDVTSKEVLGQENTSNPTRVAPQVVPIHERPISTEKVFPVTARSAQALEIGLSWSCPNFRCDFDIYAQAHPGAQVLSFSRTTTPEGTYFKDFTSSPRLTNNAYETIAFKVPVDLTRLKLAANFYRGEVAQPVQLELRISIEGRTYMKKFEMSARKGNKGNGFNPTFRYGKPANPNWIVIDPMEVIGLEKGQTLAGKR